MCRLASAASLAIAISLGASECARGGVTTWSFESVSLQYAGGTVDNPQWMDYSSPSPTVTSAPLAEGIRLAGGSNGVVFSLLGSGFNPGIDPNFGINRLFLTGTGTVDSNGWFDPQYFITTQIRAAVDLSGGLFDPYLVETAFSLLDSGGVFLSGVGSGQQPSPIGPGFHPIDLTAIDVFNEDLPDARMIRWSLGLYFDWTGFAASDTLTVSAQSIDIVATVPAAGPALMLTTAIATAALSRRRR